MRTRLFLLLFSILMSTYARVTVAQVHHQLVWDRHFSSPVAAENLQTLHWGLYAVQDRVLKPRWDAEKTTSRKLLGLTYRLGKGILLDYPVDFMLALVQHEVFGHGARAREFGFGDPNRPFISSARWATRRGVSSRANIWTRTCSCA